MPKINVYLPDELAEAVKDSAIPVSAVCQRALEQAVRRVAAVRESAAAVLEGEEAALLTPYTERARTAIRLGLEQARTEGATRVTTRHLLDGMLTEGGNLALQVLAVLEITPDAARRALASRAEEDEPGTDGDRLRFSEPAAAVLELTVAEAVGLGHNYLGCEHLLLGLVAEPDGVGGGVLRALGAEQRLTRRAVSAALAGYVHLRAQTASGGTALTEAVRRELAPLVSRLEALERAQRG